MVWASAAERERVQVRVARSMWSAPLWLNLTTGQSADIPLRATAGGLLLLRADVRVTALGRSLL
jgi:hypothetical protein